MGGFLFHSSNEYGIPDLRLDRQGAIHTPVCCWGEVARSTPIPGGTWMFYRDDYRFRALLNNPESIAKTKADYATEPNITLLDTDSLAQAIAAVYRKRYVARVWQNLGIGVLVDLCTPERFREINLLGVPPGWHSFSTRGYARELDYLVAEHKLAHDLAGDSLLLAVFGGSEPVRKLVQTLPGAVYVPNRMDRVRDRYRDPSPKNQPANVTELHPVQLKLVCHG